MNYQHSASALQLTLNSSADLISSIPLKHSNNTLPFSDVFCFYLFVWLSRICNSTHLKHLEPYVPIVASHFLRSQTHYFITLGYFMELHNMQQRGEIAYKEDITRQGTANAPTWSCYITSELQSAFFLSDPLTLSSIS